MNRIHLPTAIVTAVIALVGAAASLGASAQTTAAPAPAVAPTPAVPATTIVPVGGQKPTADTVTQRDVNQQVRIENGLKSGNLNATEASKLEANQARLDTMESKATKDGTVTAAERARIQAAQDKQSAQIYNQKHDAQMGKPNSANSQAMQATVQRDANQEQRIHNGVTSGNLTNKEAAKLEGAQAKVNAKEAAATADGKITAKESANINAAQDRRSAMIYNQKHDKNVRKN